MNPTSNASHMLLTGHSDEVLALKFSPDGSCLASGSSDESILVWRVSSHECANYMTLKGHKNAITEIHWTQDGEHIVSCSPDYSVRLWDTWKGELKRKLIHDAFVFSCFPAVENQLVISGGNNGLINIWDFRVKYPVLSIWDAFPITAVTFAKEEHMIYCGGVDNVIKVWDLRKCKVALTLAGHNETITGLCKSPDGGLLLSNSMDNSLRIWDMRPYAPNERCVTKLSGHLHSSEKNLLKCDWSPDGSLVSAGSGDQLVCIWDVSSKKMVYKLPGHNSTVNEVVFHPKKPQIGCCSSDKSIQIRYLST